MFNMSVLYFKTPFIQFGSKVSFKGVNCERMTNMVLQIVSWLLVLSLVVLCDTQTGFGVDSNDQDTEFAFAIPTLWGSGYNFNPHVMVTTTSHKPVNITLHVYGTSIKHMRVISNTSGADIQLPKVIRMEPGDAKQNNKTIIVRASDVISVYAIDNDYGEGDAFQSLPSSQLGTKYYIASIYLSNPSICLSALHSDTSVTITTISGIVHLIVLQQYESYRYDGGSGDLSSTIVQSDKPIAVVSGGFSGDGILSQLLPTISWGTLYNIFPFLSLDSAIFGFKYRVYASNISTTLFMSDENEIIIQPGGFYEGRASGDTVISFQADHSVMVSQFVDRNPGGPSMLIVPPVSLYTTNITFPVFRYISTGHTYYINVITQCENEEGLLFDETSVASWTKLTSDDKTICCLSSSVSSGYHAVKHSNPAARLFVSVYHIGDGGVRSSYAYSVMDYSILESPNAVTSAPTATTPSSQATTPHYLMPTELPNAVTSASTATTPSSYVTTPQTAFATYLGCPPFETSNGVLNPFKDLYNPGDIVTVFCGQGFDVDGDATLFCSSTHTWHGEIPQCFPNTQDDQVKDTGAISTTVIGAAAGGAVVLVVIIIVVVAMTVYCKSKKKPQLPPQLSEISTSITTTKKPTNDGDYEIPLKNTDYESLGGEQMPSNYQGIYMEIKE